MWPDEDSDEYRRHAINVRMSQGHEPFTILNNLPSSLQPPQFEFHDPKGPIYTSPRFLPPAKIIRSRVTVSWGMGERGGMTGDLLRLMGAHIPYESVYDYGMASHLTRHQRCVAHPGITSLCSLQPVLTPHFNLSPLRLAFRMRW